MARSHVLNVSLLKIASGVFIFIPAYGYAGEGLLPEDRTGYSYFSFQLGTPLTQAKSVNVTNTAGPVFSGGQNLEFDAGLIVDLIGGYYFNDRLHGEVKFTYTHGFSPTITNVTGFVGNPNAGLTVPTTGSADVVGVVANLRYDFAKFDNEARLFAGIGAGVIRMSMNNLGPTASPFHIDDSDTAYVFCLMGGVDYPIARNLELTAQYTAVSVTGTSFTSVIGPNTLTVNSESDLLHVGTIGFRYLFN